MQQIRHYLDPNGRDHFAEWRDQVRDPKARIAIDRRIYHVYYAKAGLAVVLLLCGDDKRKQNADIDRACAYWRDWQQRTGD